MVGFGSSRHSRASGHSCGQKRGDLRARIGEPPRSMLRHMAMKRAAALLLSILTLAVAVGCGKAQPRVTAQAVSRNLTLATHPSGGSSNAALISGTFHAARYGGEGCGWLQNDRTRERAYVIWPDGYQLREKDLALLDQRGTVVATIGTNIHGGGGFGPDFLSIPGCPGYRGPAFGITQPAQGPG